MRSIEMRPLTVLAVVVLIGAGCADNDPVTDVAGSEASSDGVIADEAVHDEAAPDDAVHDEAAPDEADHDEADHDEAAHDETDHEETAPDETDHEETAPDETDHDEIDMVVEVVMSEFAFEFDDLTIPVGSTVRFDFVNTGVIEHEAMFGTAHQQEEFADLGDHGDDHGDAEGHHGDIDAITLDAAGSGSVTVTFDEAGETMIGCHIPGHWDAGMKAVLTVA